MRCPPPIPPGGVLAFRLSPLPIKQFHSISSLGTSPGLGATWVQTVCANLMCGVWVSSVWGSGLTEPWSVRAWGCSGSCCSLCPKASHLGCPPLPCWLISIALELATSFLLFALSSSFLVWLFKKSLSLSLSLSACQSLLHILVFTLFLSPCPFQPLPSLHFLIFSCILLCPSGRLLLSLSSLDLCL